MGRQVVTPQVILVRLPGLMRPLKLVTLRELHVSPLWQAGIDSSVPAYTYLCWQSDLPRLVSHRHGNAGRHELSLFDIGPDAAPRR